LPSPARATALLSRSARRQGDAPDLDTPQIGRPAVPAVSVAVHHHAVAGKQIRIASGGRRMYRVTTDEDEVLPRDLRLALQKHETARPGSGCIGAGRDLRGRLAGGPEQHGGSDRRGDGCNPDGRRTGTY